jgi:uncharacterized membrane protein
MTDLRKYFSLKVVLAAFLVVCSVGLWFIPQPQPLTANEGTAVRAKVVETDESQITDVGLLKYGTQIIKAQLLSGPKKGETFTAVNDLRSQLEIDKLFKVGDTALVILKDTDEAKTSTLVARDHWRLGWAGVLFASFCVFLCWFGRWTGFKALLSFLFSCLVIWKGVIPLALHGWTASWVCFGAVVLMTFVIMYLVAGATKKGVSAFLGATVGVFAGLALSHLFGWLMNINGATMPYVQTLLFSGYEKLDLQDIFIGAMILSSSGAIMDLAVDIASGIEEVALHNKELGRKELCASGMRIGRSVVGTMTTTLLLAYSGGYLTLLMMFFSQGTDPIDFLNSTLVSAETAKTLLGSFTLVLVAPVTAIIASCMFAKRRK